MKKGKVLLIVGIIIILIAPFFPKPLIDFFYNTGWTEITVHGIVPSVVISGILIAITGIVLIGRENKV